MKNNSTLNKIDEKFNFFWMKKVVIFLMRLFGIIFYYFYKRDFFFETDNKFESNFFGYHDKKPFNYKDTKIIFHSYKNLINLEDQTKNKIFINLYDFKKNKLTKLESTDAWSWQLGASLQWHPSKDIIFFNKRINSKYVTRKIDLIKKITKDFNFSIYNISPQGDKFLIADFVKIGKLRKGYGFVRNNSQAISIYKKSKLEIIFQKKNKRKLLISFDDTKKKGIIGSYINHQTFSPKGDKIAYFYTLLKRDNQRQIFFYYYCLNKKKNFLIEISKSNLISHYCWRNNNEILFTIKKEKKIYDYVIYNITSKKYKVLNSRLNQDGHPMFNPKNIDLFVSDTYPNLLGFQKLFVYSITKKKIIWKRYIYSPYKYKGVVRCDLHPRWSNDGKKIFIDFVNNSNRNIGIFKIF